MMTKTTIDASGRCFDRNGEMVLLMMTRRIFLSACAFATSCFAQLESTPVPEKPPMQFRVLETRKISLGDRSLVLNRVVPPVLPAKTPPPAAEEPSAEALAEENRLAEKKHEVLFLSATVYDRKVTELRWLEGGRQFRIFSNIDFNLLAGAGDIETADATYMLMLGIENQPAAEVGEFGILIPALEAFSRTRSEYAVLEEDARTLPAEEKLKALDALHGYFDANRQKLTEDYAARETARVERERWLREHPPVKQDIVINYWRKPSEAPKTEAGK